MALHDSEFLELYPEEYLLEEDDMAKSYAQFQLILYLVQVLERYYQVQNWLITGNLDLYHPAICNPQGKITPHLIVFKDIEISAEERAALISWDIDEDHPAPPVVFEISSASSWSTDILEGEKCKPAIYGRIGVREYFAYDPHPTMVWCNTDGQRLLGWRYTLDNPTPQPIQPDEQNRLWSEVLESWLIADGSYLRLYDREGQIRLTDIEFGQLGRLALQQERLAHEQEQLVYQREGLTYEQEQLVYQQERLAREAAERRIAELELQLRKLQGSGES